MNSENEPNPQLRPVDLTGVVDLIIFDFDGTLCDSTDVKTEAYRLLYLDDHGPEFAERVKRYHLENVGVSRFEKVRYVEEVLLDRSCSDETVVSRAAHYGRIVMDQVIAAPLIDGAAEFLARHFGEVPMCIASAAPSDELTAIVEAKGLGRFFAAIGGSPTPKPQVVVDHIAAFDAEPTRTVVVGDQYSDWSAAQKVGAGFVCVGRSPAEAGVPDSTLMIPDLNSLDTAIIEATHAASAARRY